MSDKAPGVIRPDELYTLEEAMARTRLQKAAMRTARRAGLKVYRLGGRYGFVRGQDLIDYILANARPEDASEEVLASRPARANLKRAKPGQPAPPNKGLFDDASSNSGQQAR